MVVVVIVICGIDKGKSSCNVVQPRGKDEKPKVVTEEDVAEGRYTINDVVLPQPGEQQQL